SLGQLIEKDMGVRADGNGKLAELQSVDYRYNLRGWMTDINQTGSVNVGRGIGDFNEDLFGMELSYQDGNNPIFNGNISAMKWQVLGRGGKGSAVRSYDFTYDLLSRLKGANFSGGREDSEGEYEDFSVPHISYDLNGNISSLHRMGQIGRKNGSPVFGMMDELVYGYTGNKLIKLDDKGKENPEGGDQFIDGTRTSEEYLYDENGNIIRDLNKKISYVYNHLNKPTQASFDTGGAIQWVYTADGTKLRQRYIENGKITNYDYLNAFFYKDGQLQHLSHEEGRALLTLGSFRYEFNLTDHLGNVRVSFSDLDQNGQIEQEELLQEDHYYPFGMRMASLSFLQGTENRFRYNGKELHTELGLGLYDYGARMYDPVIGRWNGVDALSEVYDSWNPYNYTLNSPLNYIDVYGLFVSDSLINTGETAEGKPIYNYDEAVEIVAYSSDTETVSETVNTHENNITLRQALAYTAGVVGTGVGTFDNFLVNPNSYKPSSGPNQGRVTPTYRINRNGKVVTNKNSPFRIKVNGQVYKIVPRSAAALEKLKVAKNLQLGGRLLGVTGLTLTSLDIIQNGPNTSNILDLGFGIIGFLGPVGFAISTAYFVGNVAYEYYNGKTVGEELQEWVD
ncbi:MAG: RHS repeat-associated core domain-containing protein, partial [Bacteroidota bacterium]